MSNMFKVSNKNTITTSFTSFWCFFCLLWTYFTPFPSVSIVKFEQVNFSWVKVFIILFKHHKVAWNKCGSYIKSGNKAGKVTVLVISRFHDQKFNKLFSQWTDYINWSTWDVHMTSRTSINVLFEICLGNVSTGLFLRKLSYSIFLGKKIDQYKFSFNILLIDIWTKLRTTLPFISIFYAVQKQAPELLYKNRCSSKFRKIHRKTPLPESFFQ